MLHKILMMLPPEEAHMVSLALLKYLLPTEGARGFQPTAVQLDSNVMGINFVNPIGLAAGFDKNGTVFHKMISRKVGFGFAEVGTVTPVAQEGNLKTDPRIIRYPKEEMVFNRLGFNNDGLLKVIENLKKNKKKSLSAPYNSVIGLNIGKNGHTPWNEKTIKDYVLCAKSAMEHVDYLMVNISSPNTPDLISTMSDEVMLKELLDEINLAINDKWFKVRPVAVKFSPDLDPKKLEKLIDVINNSMVHGVCIGNTTTSFSKADLHGGYSGLPLYPIALKNIVMVRQMTDLPIIACGGVSNARQAIRMIKEGASLVQLYTALIYNGLGMVKKMLKEMEEIMIEEGFYSIEEMVGENR